LTNKNQVTLPVPAPFNFEAVIITHGWFQLPPFYWDDQTKTLNWAVKCDDASPILVKISQDQSAGKKKKPEATLVLPDDAEEQIQAEVIRRFRHVFNLDLNLTEFYRICTQYPILDQVFARGMGRLMRGESLYEDVFKSICGTNVQWRQAVKMIQAISQLGDAVPNTDYHVHPTPVQVLNAGEAFLKEVGRVGYRSGYLLQLCERFANGESDALRVERGEMTYEELKKYFLSFKGIGKVTARYLMALYGHFDELAVDSLVISYMTARHFNGVRPTEKQVEDFYAKFGRWRYLAYWMEFIISGGWVPDQK